MMTLWRMMVPGMGMMLTYLGMSSPVYTGGHRGELGPGHWSLALALTITA